MIMWTTYPAEKAQTLQTIRSDSHLSRKSDDRKPPAANALRSERVRRTGESCEHLAVYFRSVRLKDWCKRVIYSKIS
jgi:hypothetical protein